MDDRLPPHSTEAEQGVLGCLFLSPHDCIGECVEKLSGPEAFYDIRHQTIYAILVLMYEAREAIDVITVQQRLKDRNELENVGGISYLATLPDTVPSAANLSFYLNIVREKFVLRKIINTCSAAVAKAYAHQGGVDTLLDELERDTLAISQGGIAAEVPIKELVKKELEYFEACHGSGGRILGISTGFRDLDRMTGGLKGGDYFVLAGRPSTGKTSLAMNIAEAAAVTQKIPVGVFSLEMSRGSLVRRLICSKAKVNERHLTQGVASQPEIMRMAGASSAVSVAPLHIDDTANMPILQLRARARRMHQRHGIKLLLIDYLQLLKAITNRNDNRVNELTNVSNGIKALAKELDIPVIALAQLSREVERDGNRKPRMSDLRECGAIEQDADIIGMLYRPEENPDPSAMIIPVSLCINKQRNGPTGEVEFTFFKEFTRFEPRAYDNP